MGYILFFKYLNDQKETQKLQALIHLPYRVMNTSSEAISMRNYILSWKVEI